MQNNVHVEDVSSRTLLHYLVNYVSSMPCHWALPLRKSQPCTATLRKLARLCNLEVVFGKIGACARLRKQPLQPGATLQKEFSQPCATLSGTSFATLRNLILHLIRNLAGTMATSFCNRQEQTVSICNVEILGSLSLPLILQIYYHAKQIL